MNGLGITLNVILVVLAGGFLAYNIYKIVIQCKEKKKKKVKDTRLNEKEDER